MEIYIDVLFFINFITDFLLLVLCDMRFTRVIKKVLAAVIGSLYACLFVFDVPEIIYSLPGKITVLALMCLVAYCPCSAMVFLKKCAAFLVASALFCGVFYAGSVFFNNPYFLYNISDVVWIFCIFSAFFTGRFIVSQIKNSLYSDKCKIKIQYNKKSVTLKGMIDTGNALKDPVSSLPVLVIDEEILKKLFSPSATKNNLCEFINPEDFRIIPYKTISDSGITYGFIPEKLFFEDKEIKNTIVAVAPSPISSDALISPQII